MSHSLQPDIPFSILLVLQSSVVMVKIQLPFNGLAKDHRVNSFSLSLSMWPRHLRTQMIHYSPFSQQNISSKATNNKPRTSQAGSTTSLPLLACPAPKVKEFIPLIKFLYIVKNNVTTDSL